MMLETGCVTDGDTLYIYTARRRPLEWCITEIKKIKTPIERRAKSDYVESSETWDRRIKLPIIILARIRRVQSLAWYNK